jgi:hypothetical protein
MKHVSENGRTIRRSPTAYHSLGTALGNAMLYGFDGAQDKFRLIELG